MADGAKQEEGKGGKAIPFVVIGVVLLVFVLVGVVAFVLLSGGDDNAKPTPSSPSYSALTPEAQALMQNDSLRNPAALYPIEDDIIVNLKSPNPDDATRGGYLLLRVTLVLGDKNLVQELTAKDDIIRSIIISTVPTFSTESLKTMQGVQRLKVDIANNINAVLHDGVVGAVVFPKFTLQP